MTPLPELAAAIDRVCAEGSLYWAFLDADDLDRTAEHEVEIRIDAPPGTAPNLDGSKGWRVAHVRLGDGIVYLRRAQSLTRDAVREMFAEALTLADRHDGRFHSWLHAPHLPDWSAEARP